MVEKKKKYYIDINKYYLLRGKILYCKHYKKFFFFFFKISLKE
jgi:hypothetical protein